MGPTAHFEELALPALSEILEPPDTLLTARDATSITSVYNHFIDEARAMSDVEALVLLHDDVILQDRNFAPRVRRVLRDPTVGVIGVVGGSRLCNMSFWEGRTTKGRVWDGARFLDFGPLRGDVDVVDGLLMVLSPAAMTRYGSMRRHSMASTGTTPIIAFRAVRGSSALWSSRLSCTTNLREVCPLPPTAPLRPRSSTNGRGRFHVRRTGQSYCRTGSVGQNRGELLRTSGQLFAANSTRLSAGPGLNFGAPDRRRQTASIVLRPIELTFRVRR